MSQFTDKFRQSYTELEAGEYTPELWRPELETLLQVIEKIEDTHAVNQWEHQGQTYYECLECDEAGSSAILEHRCPTIRAIYEVI